MVGQAVAIQDKPNNHTSPAAMQSMPTKNGHQFTRSMTGKESALPLGVDERRTSNASMTLRYLSRLKALQDVRDVND